MATREATPAVEIFLEEARDFVRTSPEEILGNLVNLTVNDHEPILVFDDDKYLGAISLQKTVINSRLPYLSRADSNLTNSGPLKPSSRVDSAIRQMISYGWLRLPVFSEKMELIGQVTARKILKAMAQTDTFLNAMTGRSRIKRPIILDDEARVEDGFLLLKSKRQNLIFVVDKAGKLLGLVNKNGLIKALVQRVDSKKSRTRSGSPESNIYVGEKIDKDDYPITDYIFRKRYGLSVGRKTSKERMIKKLLDSNFYELVVADENNLPLGVLCFEDLLRSVLVRDVTGALNLKIRGFENVKKPELREIDIMIGNLAEFANRIDGVEQIDLSNKEVLSPEGKINLYEMMLKLDLYSGKTYISNKKARDPVAGVRQLTETIKNQIERAE